MRVQPCDRRTHDLHELPAPAGLRHRVVWTTQVEFMVWRSEADRAVAGLEELGFLARVVPRDPGGRSCEIHVSEVPIVRVGVLRSVLATLATGPIELGD